MLLVGLDSDCSDFSKPSQLTLLFTEEHISNLFKCNTFCLQTYLFHSLTTWYSILSAVFRVQYFPVLIEHGFSFSCCVAEVRDTLKRTILPQPE